MKPYFDAVEHDPSTKNAVDFFLLVSVRSPRTGHWAAEPVMIRAALGWHFWNNPHRWQLQRRQLSKLDAVDILDEASLGSQHFPQVVVEPLVSLIGRSIHDKFASFFDTLARKISFSKDWSAAFFAGWSCDTPSCSVFYLCTKSCRWQLRLQRGCLEIRSLTRSIKSFLLGRPLLESFPPLRFGDSGHFIWGLCTGQFPYSSWNLMKLRDFPGSCCRVTVSFHFTLW